MKKILIFVLISVVTVGCNSKSRQAKEAENRVNVAKAMVADGNLNAAKLLLDSVHVLYPRQVEWRRAAKTLMDSIVYIEAKRTLQYSDSILQPLLPEIDNLLKNFNSERDVKYETNGRYVHKQLPTGRNVERCFIQAYINEDLCIVLKSYYCGNKPIEHDKVIFTSGEDYQVFSGTGHSFDDGENQYEILTLNENDAMQALSFIVNHNQDRLKVTLSGRSDYVYYLNQNEKHALTETCQLSFKMRDVQRLEQQINVANAQILKYENRTRE